MDCATASSSIMQNGHTKVQTIARRPKFISRDMLLLLFVTPFSCRFVALTLGSTVDLMVLDELTSWNWEHDATYTLRDPPQTHKKSLY